MASITHVAVTGPVYSSSHGCQDGYSIFADGGGTNVQLANDSVSNYHKAGIACHMSGNVCDLNNDTVVGQPPNNVISPNGVEFREGATGNVTNSTIVDTFYTGGHNSVQPTADDAFGILYEESRTKPVQIQGDTLVDDEGGIVLMGASAQVKNVVTEYDSALTGSTDPNSVGVFVSQCDVYQSECPPAGLSNPAYTVSIQNSLLQAQGDDVLVSNYPGSQPNQTGPAGTLNVQVQNTDLLGGNTAAGVENDPTASVTATHNWWGCATGPNTDNCTTTDLSPSQYTPYQKNPIPEP